MRFRKYIFSPLWFPLFDLPQLRWSTCIFYIAHFRPFCPSVLSGLYLVRLRRIFFWECCFTNVGVAVATLRLVEQCYQENRQGGLPEYKPDSTLAACDSRFIQKPDSESYPCNCPACIFIPLRLRQILYHSSIIYYLFTARYDRQQDDFLPRR